MKYAYCIPANIYGPHDNFHAVNSHVVPGLIRRFVECVQKKYDTINIWGNGEAKRDFLFIDDLISAIALLVDNRFEGPINIATGTQTTINELAESIAQLTNYTGQHNLDTSQPAGQKEREFNIDKIAKLNWQPQISLKSGLSKTIEWFKINQNNVRER